MDVWSIDLSEINNHTHIILFPLEPQRPFCSGTIILHRPNQKQHNDDCNYPQINARTVARRCTIHLLFAKILSLPYSFPHIVFAAADVSAQRERKRNKAPGLVGCLATVLAAGTSAAFRCTPLPTRRKITGCQVLYFAALCSKKIITHSYKTDLGWF